MVDIKIKQNEKKTIKTINKALVSTEKMKNNLVQTKDKTKELYKEENSNSGTNYAIRKISSTISSTPNNVKKLNNYGKSDFKQTIINIKNTNQKIKLNKKRNHAKKVARKMVKATKNTARTTKKVIKTADRTIKTTKETVKATAKITQRTLQMVKQTARATIQTIKVSIKAIVTAIKAIIVGTKALIATIIAGGWVVIIVIIIICLVGLLCSSIFGIFFSSEHTTNGKNMSSVILEINNEFIAKITEIQNSNSHDEYDINSNRAEWKDVLAIYTIKISNGKDDTEVMTLSDEKIKILKQVFWDMNSISSNTETVTKQIITTDDKGNTKTENKEQKILHITVTSKKVEEMIEMYHFNDKQKIQLAELLNEEYEKMWLAVIHGNSEGSNDIVQVALSQLGNIGGQPYWSWYGFSQRVEWCACFVSWCAEQCGYIQAGIIPKFAACQSEGVKWFKTCGLWKEKGYSPKAGDIVFFDWEDSKDGQADHVGIVEKTENGRVYTIEGNSKGDVCKQKDYDINSNVILGYGTPMY